VAPAEAVRRSATPGRIDGLAKATRAIVVYSWSSKSTRAVMRTYQRARPGDRWRLVRGPMPARIGYNGFSANRPRGRRHHPGRDLRVRVRLRQPPRSGMRGFAYRRLRAASCWSGSRADYNRWVTRPCAYGERLWKNRMGPAAYLNNRL
jgi:L,D-peptidoglycan transpeptidase YkuD (ErfK/YbiS/YcfS/YnhG family)